MVGKPPKRRARRLQMAARAGFQQGLEAEEHLVLMLAIDRSRRDGTVVLSDEDKDDIAAEIRAIAAMSINPMHVAPGVDNARCQRVIAALRDAAEERG